jgi:hypothetical protein
MHVREGAGAELGDMREGGVDEVGDAGGEGGVDEVFALRGFGFGGEVLPVVGYGEDGGGGGDGGEDGRGDVEVGLGVGRLGWLSVEKGGETGSVNRVEKGQKRGRVRVRVRTVTTSAPAAARARAEALVESRVTARTVQSESLGSVRKMRATEPP